MFVAIGMYGTPIVSTNGSSWVRGTPGSVEEEGWLRYGNGFFLRCVVPNILRKSTDGMNWQSLPWVGFTGTATGLAFVEGQFVVLVGDPSFAPLIYTSATADGWTNLPLPFTSYVSLGDLCYSAGRYVTVGTYFDVTRTAYVPCILTSTNGVDWQRASLSWFWEGRLTHVVYGKGLFVATGYDTGGGYVIVSEDGLNWRPGALRDPWAFTDAAFVEESFVLLGLVSQLHTSADGLTWRSRPFGTEIYAKGIAYGHNTFVAVAPVGAILQSDSILALSVRRPLPPLELSISGPAGRSCTIEGTGDLGATNNWRPLTTLTLAEGGTIWTDTNSAVAGSQVYRAVLAPEK
jgi:hypothetical protein